MKIYFITSNKGKFEWAKRRLKNSDIELEQKVLSIEESRDKNVEEVALFKANKAEEFIREPFIVEDSGFCITALNNFPTTHINFVLSTIGLKGIMKLMEGEKEREVIFKSALVFSYQKQKKLFVCNDIGTFSETQKGENLHGFNELLQVFVPQDFNKTLAEMTDKEFEDYEALIEDKDHYSQFLNWYKKEIRHFKTN